MVLDIRDLWVGLWDLMLGFGPITNKRMRLRRARIRACGLGAGRPDVGRGSSAGGPPTHGDRRMHEWRGAGPAADGRGGRGASPGGAGSHRRFRPLARVCATPVGWRWASSCRGAVGGPRRAEPAPTDDFARSPGFARRRLGGGGRPAVAGRSPLLQTRWPPGLAGRCRLPQTIPPAARVCATPLGSGWRVGRSPRRPMGGAVGGPRRTEPAPTDDFARSPGFARRRLGGGGRPAVAGRSPLLQTRAVSPHRRAEPAPTDDFARSPGFARRRLGGWRASSCRGAEPPPTDDCGFPAGRRGLAGRSRLPQTISPARPGLRDAGWVAVGARRVGRGVGDGWVFAAGPWALAVWVVVLV